MPSWGGIHYIYSFRNGTAITPEKRLDQLEPLLAEHSAQLDLHTAQLRRIAYHIQQIGEGVAAQSDNISFWLREQAELKERVGRLEIAIGRLEAEIAQLRSDMNTRLTRIEDMVVAIHQAVQKPSGN